jgi:hypothetical protein
MNNDFFIDRLRSVYRSKGYTFFEKGDFNLNIGGIRANSCQSDLWDDIRFAVYKRKGLWQVRSWKQTTDPGKPCLLNPSRPQGAAILCPGQHCGAFAGGFHKQDRKRYALLQAKPLPVYRDGNKDDQLDFDPASIETGMIGLNMHGPYADELERVGEASAGCQVAFSQADHTEFMTLYDISKEKYGEMITYTLFTEQDFQ